LNYFSLRKAKIKLKNIQCALKSELKSS